MIKVRWIGAAGLEFTFEGKTILVDPYMSRIGAKALSGPLVPDKGRIQAYLDQLPGKLSAVIVGHTHFDHALDIPEIARAYEGPLVGSQSLETLMNLNDVKNRVTVCQGGETVPLFPGAAVTMLPSEHGIIGDSVPAAGEIDPGQKLPMRAEEYKLGTIFMARLELGDSSFIMAGSAGCRLDKLEGSTCDVLFMCVPGWKLAPGYTQRLPQLLKPGIIIPYHYDNFFRPFNPDGSAPELPDLDMEAFRESVIKSAPQAEFRPVRTFHLLEI